MNNLDIDKLKDVYTACKKGESNKQQQDLLVQLLFDNKSITNRIYIDYHNDKDVDIIIQCCLTISSIILAGDVLADALQKYSIAMTDKQFSKDDMFSFTRFVWYNKDLKDTSKGLEDYFDEWKKLN